MPSTLDFKQFLRTAKLATYAAQGGASSIAPLLLDSKQLEYRDGSFLYRDIYVGMFRFVGQEIVYLSDRAIWSMSYSGGIPSNEATPQVRGIYTFLRQALLNAPTDLPLRGPAMYQADDMSYVCQCEGSIEQFHGVETITQANQLRYELYFSGGNLA